MEGLLLCHAFSGRSVSLSCSFSDPGGQKGQNMAKEVKKFSYNYNGRAIGENEVMVPFEWTETEDGNCTNRECIKTLTQGNRHFKVIYKAVDREWAKTATSALNLVQNEALGHYDVPNSVSMNAMEDEFELSLGETPSAEEVFMEEEELTESQKAFVKKYRDMIDKSPKHGLCMLLMSLGYKGDKLAGIMKMSKPGANYVREQILSLAPDQIERISQIDVDSLNARGASDAEYYRSEAEKFLKVVMQMYFAADN